ncbi:MAG: tetratricopeptide repeat protein, partial [Phycisphaerales bacterium]
MALRTIKVFIASPGDLAEERRAFKDTIDELNQGFGRGANVVFQPLGWEDALSQVGRRSQSVINLDVDACDIFVLVMWRRWGQEAPDAAPYSSYTEEEFYRAMSRREKKDTDGKNRPAVCVFFKRIDPAFLTDPGDQLKKVLAFRRKLEQTKAALYRPFDELPAFVSEIKEHLIGFAQGRFDGVDDDRSAPLVPDSVTAEIEKHKVEAQRAVAELQQLKAEKQKLLEEAEHARTIAKDASERADAAEKVAEARAAVKSVELAERASKAALEGKIEEARQDFASALDGTTNLRVLSLGFAFFERIGELDEAERLLRRKLSISGPEAESATTAAAYGNLGLIEMTRGNLDAAELYHKKSLAIEKKLNRADGMASDYNNLGIIEQTRGNFVAATAYHKKSLAMNEKLSLSEGMSGNYTNLGIIEQINNNLVEAELYHKKSLAINDRLGRVEGMAT